MLTMVYDLTKTVFLPLSLYMISFGGCFMMTDGGNTVVGIYHVFKLNIYKPPLLIDWAIN